MFGECFAQRGAGTLQSRLHRCDFDFQNGGNLGK
jgi:hypothetical protein